MRRRAALATLAGAALLAAPRTALACAVCMSGQDDSVRAAFLGTTALLSLLPLAMVGGLVGWLWRRARVLEREAAREAPSSE